MGRRKLSAAAPPSRSWSNVGGGVVISELRERHKMELENLTLTKQPLRTLHFFMLAMLRYVKRLATYLLNKSGLFVLIIVLVVAPGILLFVSDGLHKKHVQEFLNYAEFVLWWVSLGVASSIGLGSGLHTFVLYLGPHIALFTIKAVQCGRVDLKMAPYDTIQLKVGPSWLDKKCSEFGPPVYPSSAHSVRIPVFDLLPQIQLEAILWGIGTALGELPPYFISRAARLSGSKSKAVKELDAATSKEDGPVASTLNRTKRWLLSHSQHLNFFTILILASVPNPLFDLAGIMCGQFGVPFWEFFFATLIGKAIIKTHIQTLFIVSLCNNQLLYLMEKELIWIFGHIPGFSATLPSVIAKLHAAKEKYLSPSAPVSPSSQMEDKQWNFSFTLVWNTVVWLVLVNFFIKIITSTAQDYLKKQQDIEMELITDTSSPDNS
ncbi:vacuole membrane protein KMS1-like [Phragmites australis]|uniref:vacuole membrane protein KMS1-like n=1 Tax=Phragmites australis TaxID=29695 RepID=UPI002D7697E8|nr:vacuole membrane protein KMS1-like [Phragmites australis]